MLTLLLWYRNCINLRKANAPFPPLGDRNSRLDVDTYMGLKRKVLVVDDDPLICWSLERALQGDGHEVSVSHTGEDAMEKLKEYDFDMVITDLKMARINGLEVLESAKSLCPSAKSVLMTAFGS